MRGLLSGIFRNPIWGQSVDNIKSGTSCLLLLCGIKSLEKYVLLNREAVFSPFFKLPLNK